MSAKVTSPIAYLGVFAALMVLTFLTVWVAFQDLGAFNDLVAMAIAFTKTCLVVWIFMGMRNGSPLARLMAVGAFLWLIFLFALTLADYWTRGFLG